MDMKHIKEFAQLFESTRELTLEQKDWLDKCTKGTYSFNPQTGLVDINGDFHCSKQGLTDFKGVRFGYVRGSFICFSNRLTSLEGAPKKVGGDFSCFNNKITSLKGAPQEVGWNFDCSSNDIVSLEGAPRRIVNDVDASGNPISKEVLRFILTQIGTRGKTLGYAVSECWRMMDEKDKIYLAKENPDLDPEEKRGYEALLRHMNRVV